jgi:hypothetical protein
MTGVLDRTAGVGVRRGGEEPRTGGKAIGGRGEALAAARAVRVLSMKPLVEIDRTLTGTRARATFCLAGRYVRRAAASAKRVRTTFFTSDAGNRSP